MTGSLPIKELFNDLIELPADRRPARLDELCGSDPSRRARLEQLLKAHENAGGLLADATIEREILGEPAAADEIRGRQFGPFRVLERLGEGGFGTVYLAEQEHPVRRRVALKIIKPGMDSRQVIARFEAERQALAMMDHPNIARVLDAGTTDASSPLGSGRPYFVMELVRGVPITQFCDQQRPALRERLALFIDACHAVQHAHQKGIIHRDLKPSNILVVPDDPSLVSSRRRSVATVKIIDFGIAKAISGRLTDMTLFTEMRQLIGTPAYMSPEQAGLSDLDIDTRSDIYSLGVLLYVLLTGTTPFDAARLRGAGLDELRRIIREEDPPRPSTRLSSLKGGTGIPPAPERVPPADDSSAGFLDPSILRSLDPSNSRSLVRSLRGDLDWIVMKCLEKDRARRYETASALALDVDRFLRDEPVSAGPPSSAYRLRKALRRYRGPFSAAAAFLLILLGGTVVSTVFWQRAERQATRAQEVKRILERFISFPQPMLSMLHAGAATKTFGPDVQLIKVVDEAARSLEVTPAGQPEIEADVRFALGKSYFGLSRVSESEKQLEGAWVLYHRLFGDDDRRTIECLNMLGTAQFWAGDYDAGVSSIRTAISGFVRHIGPRDEVTLGAKLVLAIYVVHRPDGFAEAERLAREVLDARRAKQPQALRDVSMAQAVLAFVLCGAGKADEARPMANEAVEQITRSPERTDADEFFCRHVLGNCELGRDRLEEAEQQYRLAIGAGDRVAGSDSLMCAITRGQLGSCLIAQKRFDEAEPILRKSLDTRQRSVGPTHPYTVVCVCDLASARFALGRTSEAEMELRQCLEECVRRDGPDHPNTRMAVERVTQTLGTVGRPEQEVNELLRRLLEEADGPNRR